MAQDAAVLGEGFAEGAQDARTGLDTNHYRQHGDKLARLTDRYDAQLRRTGIAKEGRGLGAAPVVALEHQRAVVAGVFQRKPFGAQGFEFLPGGEAARGQLRCLAAG